MIEKYVGLPVSDLAKMSAEQERHFLREHHSSNSKKLHKGAAVNNGIYARGSILGALGRTVTSSGPIKCYLDDNHS